MDVSQHSRYVSTVNGDATTVALRQVVVELSSTSEPVTTKQNKPIWRATRVYT